jgi:hypothetical protein
MSWVALRCWAVSTSMPDMMALISESVVEMPSIAPRVSPVMPWMLATWSDISSFALPVWWARFFTSEATTENPLPASPARAASMVALSASRLVPNAVTFLAETKVSLFKLVAQR